jgi:hypothetical protein
MIWNQKSHPSHKQAAECETQGKQKYKGFETANPFNLCVCVCVCVRERERESIPWSHVSMIQHHLHLANHPCLELCDSYQGDPILRPY